jgi:hypothetical protein
MRLNNSCSARGSREAVGSSKITNGAPGCMGRPRCTWHARHVQRGKPAQRGISTSAVGSQQSLGAVDGDVAGGRTRPQRDVRLAGLGLIGGLQPDADVARHGTEVEPSGQIVGYPDGQGA